MSLKQRPVELRQPAGTLLFPGFVAVVGLLFLFFGRALGMSSMPAWARLGMTVGSLVLSAIGFAYFLTYRLYADQNGIQQYSLFHKRIVNWSELSVYAYGLQADGSGWNTGDSVLRLLDTAGQERMTVPLSLVPEVECKRLVSEIQERFQPATDAAVRV
jgi:hypothetical protein